MPDGKVERKNETSRQFFIISISLGKKLKLLNEKLVRQFQNKTTIVTSTTIGIKIIKSYADIKQISPKDRCFSISTDSQVSVEQNWTATD